MARVSGEAVTRAASAALWANGAIEVLLRLPGVAVSGSDAEQMGLGTPDFRDMPVGPAVWRKPGAVDELLLGAEAIAELMGSESVDSAEVLFQEAVGVVVAGVLYLILRSEALTVAGAPCAYRLKVQPPQWN